jgi:hypothetical protein
MSHLSVQTQLVTVSSHPNYYIQKQVQLLSPLSMNKCIVFLQFLNKGSTVIFVIYFHRHYIYHYIFHSFVLVSLIRMTCISGCGKLRTFRLEVPKRTSPKHKFQKAGGQRLGYRHIQSEGWQWSDMVICHGLQEQ